MKTALYIMLSIGASLIFSTMKLMAAVSADKLEFAHQVLLSGLGFFGIGLVMAGCIGMLYLMLFQNKS